MSDILCIDIEKVDAETIDLVISQSTQSIDYTITPWELEKIKLAIERILNGTSRVESITIK